MKRVRTSSSRESMRRKLVNLVFVATVPLVVAVALAVSTLGVQLWRQRLAGIEATTALLHEMVDVSIRESIVAYLRAKVETGITTIDWIDATQRSSTVEEIAEQLLTIKVADSGYLYVLDYEGRVVIHPDDVTRGRTIPEVEPVRTQLEQRSGYLEYSWQNSFEPILLPKALYMMEYEPRDWIVSASSYREEFVQLVDRDRLAATVGAHTFDGDSYSVIVDRSGSFIAHPSFPGHHISEFFDAAEADRVMEALFSEDDGSLRYSWADYPGGDRQRPKLLFYRYLPDLDWSIATTVYLDSFRRPTILFVTGLGVLVAVLMSGAILWGLHISRAIAAPIAQLARAAEAAQTVAADQFPRGVPREIERLSRRFNEFVERIEEQRAEMALQQQDLERALQEKTVLIREIHHRVKNNLQVISSLLNVQAGQVRDPEDAILFERSGERVISMALVHEQLYQTDDLSLIPFDRYLRELMDHLGNSVRSDRVELEVDAEELSMEIHRAIPCGLIVNELVVNAVEHAFPGEAAGTIRVGFYADGEGFRLEVSDTGVGMPSTMTKSLGMTLVEMLAGQIGAVIEVSSGEGATVRLTIPA
jgi:two-component sensor histidine kinase